MKYSCILACMCVSDLFLKYVFEFYGFLRTLQIKSPVGLFSLRPVARCECQVGPHKHFCWYTGPNKTQFCVLICIQYLCLVFYAALVVTIIQLFRRHVTPMACRAVIGPNIRTFQFIRYSRSIKSIFIFYYLVAQTQILRSDSYCKLYNIGEIYFDTLCQVLVFDNVCWILCQLQLVSSACDVTNADWFQTTISLVNLLTACAVVQYYDYVL